MTLESKIEEALHAAGIAAGDTVFVHSAVRGLVLSLLAEGRRDGNLVEAAAEVLHSAISTTLGANGTIASPAFFYEYGRYGTPFDAATSPTDKRLGGFCSWMLNVPGMRRSLCPTVSVIASGKNASEICDTGTGFGYGSMSPWQRLVDLDAKMLFWECTPRMMTFVHHVEVLAGVPHTYNKVYDAPVTGLDGPFDGPVVSAVRYLDEDFEIVYELARFTTAATEAGIVRTAKMGSLNLQVIGFRDAEALLLEKLSQDPYFLLVKPPVFTPGKIPFDGGSGAVNPKLRHVAEKVSVEVKE
ncbi:MAG: hypothetical protein HOK06_01565 [Rhodospirillaceae bacterium]|jgi:aminoglycoside N3'-acetyltransferase|nr:hypothetical protein [Rhodospirillaceae bacterium]MBT4219287.1 hypothetical protein [Rhodospirillaceae bacterium]MBT4463078.1 hypothetical protein [Rhodospirillaceae bacterium]MBT5309365.1 hypothetical protein [Rhodospirillaceae bacterium]MBT6406266.1 hypothetical protein [Rhodospirillaceae bacterium]